MKPSYFSVSDQQSRLRDAALSWVGTPFHANGRVKGPNGGVSCVGLVYAISLEIGLIAEGEINLPDAPIAWHNHNDFSLLADFFRSPEVRSRIKRMPDKDHYEVGDLITLKVKRAEHHLCWLIEENKVIHCHMKKGVMVSHLKNLEALIEGVYRINLEWEDGE
jgi:hypothetical protein